jgi:MFS transporter, DHA1 family, multidrug resistance protein
MNKDITQINNPKKYIPLLALLSAFPPLSTDMYLPAIPVLQKQWSQPLDIINITLVIYFVTYCVFMLIYGPLSDKYGRRKPIIVGTVIYIIGSFVCAFSPNVYFLIAARFLQAAGDAGAAVIAVAISRDLFEGTEREKVLAYLGMIVPLAPMIAPVLGGWMLLYLSWHWIFIVQAFVGVIACIFVFYMPETSMNRIPGNPLVSMKKYIVVMKNKRFVAYCFALSTVALPFFGFIAGSPSIYINQFGVSEQNFGFYFGCNAMAIMVASFIFTRLIKYVRSKHIATVGYIGGAIGGLIMFVTVPDTPLKMLFAMVLITFSFALTRAPVNNTIIEQVSRKEAGTAASLMVSVTFMFGAIAMYLISLDWSSKIYVIGLMSFIVGVSMFVFWVFMQYKYEFKKLISYIKF